MSQPSAGDSDVDATPSGLTLRTEFNDIILAILTKYSGATEPAETFPYMNWIDTSSTPSDWNIRNAADDGWIKIAEIGASSITLFSNASQVLGLANTSPFTQPQVIDVTGAPGLFTIRSDRTTGIAASVDLAGHDSGGNDTVYASVDMEINTATDGAESGQIVLRVLRGGSEVSRVTIGAVVTVNGTLNATTLQQGGTPVADLIEAEINSIDQDTTTAAAVNVPADLTAGQMEVFTGSVASSWTINSGSADEVYPILNDGTATITFVAGSGVTIAAGGLSLAPGQTCTVFYRSATRVFIWGQNT